MGGNSQKFLIRCMERIRYPEEQTLFTLEIQFLPKENPQGFSIASAHALHPNEA
jgi:hypothetical protein